MKKKFKLYILRVVMIMATTVAEAVAMLVPNTSVGVYRYPLRWLRHYLVGSGKPLEVPSNLVLQAKSALEEAVRRNNYDTIGDVRKSPYGKFCVGHSTLYEGSGFYGRPTLFYLLGGFTFNVYPRKGGGGVVSGKDHYDWHPAVEDKYFTSPLGSSKGMLLLVKMLGLVFGDDLFVTNGWPMGEAGISNKLWHELEQVGARGFWSYFSNIPMWDKEELDELVNSAYWYKWEDNPAYVWHKSRNRQFDIGLSSKSMYDALNAFLNILDEGEASLGVANPIAGIITRVTEYNTKSVRGITPKMVSRMWVDFDIWEGQSEPDKNATKSVLDSMDIELEIR